MLGTNDTKIKIPIASGEWDNWLPGPAGAEFDYTATYRVQMKAAQPTFANSYSEFLTLARTLGTDGGRNVPAIFLCVPPPALADGLDRTQQQVVNHVLPGLVPLIAREANLPKAHVIDLHGALGGHELAATVPKTGYPKGPLASPPMSRPGCFFCDGDPNSGDNLHPVEAGCEAIAEAIHTALARAGTVSPSRLGNVALL